MNSKNTRKSPSQDNSQSHSNKNVNESISYGSGEYSSGFGPFWNDSGAYNPFQFPSAGQNGWVDPVQLAIRDNYLSGEQLPVYLTWWQLKSIRDRARYVYAVNEFAHGIVGCFQNFVVGSTGFKWRVANIDLRTPVPEDILKRCQNTLDIFREYNNMVEVENEIVYRLHVDGEVFIRKFPQANGMLVIRFIEPELVRGYASDIGSPKDSFGIIAEEDDINTVLGYQVIQKPWETKEPTFVEANQIIHIKFGTNANAKRGLTSFYPVFQNLNNCEDILASTVTMAKARAKIAMIRKVANVAPDSMSNLVDSTVDATINDNNPMTGNNLKLERFGYGSIITTPENISYEFPGMNVDAAGLIEVLQANLRSLATRFGISETLVSGDASNNNYSSALIAEAPARRTFERWQGIVGRSLAECRFEPNKSLAWTQLQLAADHGIIPKDILKNLKITAEACSLQSRDHQKEAEMNRMYLDMGVKSIQTIRSEVGLDNDTEASNINTHANNKPGSSETAAAPNAAPAGNKPEGEATDNVQDTALNGAQIQSLVNVVTQCVQGLLPISSGIAIAKSSFPLIPQSVIDAIFKDIEVKKTPEPETPKASKPLTTDTKKD